MEKFVRRHLFWIFGVSEFCNFLFSFTGKSGTEGFVLCTFLSNMAALINITREESNRRNDLGHGIKEK